MTASLPSPLTEPVADASLQSLAALLHLASQMIGKIRVAHAPWVNHGWHAALQPNARGLGIYPTAASGDRTFTLTLDLCRHAIVLWTFLTFCSCLPARLAASSR